MSQAINQRNLGWSLLLIERNYVHVGVLLLARLDGGGSFGFKLLFSLHLSILKFLLNFSPHSLARSLSLHGLNGSDFFYLVNVHSELLLLHLSVIVALLIGLVHASLNSFFDLVSLSSVDGVFLLLGCISSTLFHWDWPLEIHHGLASLFFSALQFLRNLLQGNWRSFGSLGFKLLLDLRVGVLHWLLASKYNVEGNWIGSLFLSVEHHLWIEVISWK